MTRNRTETPIESPERNFRCPVSGNTSGTPWRSFMANYGLRKHTPSRKTDDDFWRGVFGFWRQQLRMRQPVAGKKG